MIHPEHNLSGSEPKKDKNDLVLIGSGGPYKKESTGILKDLTELKRYCEVAEGFDSDDYRYLEEDPSGMWIKRSDVEEIINKYSNP